MQDRETRRERRFHVPVLVATLLVLPVFLLQAPDVPSPWSTIGDIGNMIIWLVFLAEVVAMLVVARDRRTWARSHWVDIAIVVLTPPFTQGVLNAIRFLRLVRIVRLFRLAPLMRSLFTVDGVTYTALLAFLTVLAGAESFSVVEDTSCWHGIYWALSTMTTVGYGDLSPTTTSGQAIAIVVMLVGIGFVAVVTGAIAQRFTGDRQAIVASETETHHAEAATHAKLDDLARRMERMEQALLNLTTMGPSPNRTDRA
jgi:voltage-gated potassium channel